MGYKRWGVMITDYLENNYKIIFKIIIFFMVLLLGIFLKSVYIKIIFTGIIMGIYILKSYRESTYYKKIKDLEKKLEFYKEKERKEVREGKNITLKKEEDEKNYLPIISHEFRTPLTCILGFSKIIKKKLNKTVLYEINELKKENEDKRLITIENEMKKILEKIDIVIEEGEKLTSMMNSLFSLTKIERGEVTYKKEEVSMEEVINRSIITCYKVAMEKNIEIIEEIEGELPNIIGDKDKLIQLMINLVHNGVKFTKVGKVICKARAHRDNIIISVEDTGRGMKSEEIPLLFNKFYQGNNDGISYNEGCGLGLAISKSIVESHGGAIWVESEENTGSRFTFTIPCKSCF